MPFDPILTPLREHRSGRVIRADDAWVQSGDFVAPRFTKPSGSIQRVGHKPGLWVELDIA